MKIITIIFLSLLLPACVTAPIHTDTQIIASQTRTFNHVTTEQFLESVRLLFQLADEPSVQFQVTPRGITAHRVAMVLTSGIGETWEFGFTETANHSLRVVASAEATFNVAKFYPQNTFPYDLAFARLGYLLDQGDSWESCNEYHKRTGLDENLPNHDFLCLNAKDAPPKALWARYNYPPPNNEWE